MTTSSTPKSLPTGQPFTFAAHTTKNLLRGELIVFFVDPEGRIRSEKLDFIRPPLFALKPDNA